GVRRMGARYARGLRAGVPGVRGRDRCGAGRHHHDESAKGRRGMSGTGATLEQAQAAGRKIEADLLIAGATIITLNAERQVIADGALAIRGERIAAVGKREALERTVRARRTIDGRRFVMTPG